MSTREFDDLVESGLLAQVEAIVVEAHRALHEKEGRQWSRPAAYHWLRYEDPAPVERLADGVRRLRRRGAEFDLAAVDKVCARASKQGFLN
jgi:predicted RNA polymerase sigma factor